MLRPCQSTPAGPVEQRRQLLLSALALTAALAPSDLLAGPDEMAKAVLAFTGGARVRKGLVRLVVEPLVENGNTVPVSLSVECPTTPESHVLALALFNQHNPRPEVIRVQFAPRCGSAVVATRIRLATSQRLLALAQLSDGSFWSDEAEVIVTLAACIETEVQE